MLLHVEIIYGVLAEIIEIFRASGQNSEHTF